MHFESLFRPRPLRWPGGFSEEGAQGKGFPRLM